MYRIKPLDTGKYQNVEAGYRYCIRAKDVVDLIRLFKRYDCKYTIEKLVRVDLVFFWSSTIEEFSKKIIKELREG